MPPIHQMFPPAPTFTEKELPDQAGKVVIITGGASGMGFELCKILYEKNATVYIAARSQKRVDDAAKAIRASSPPSVGGRLESMVIDLADLTTIGKAAADFLAREDRLDVLFHNAGVMNTSTDRKSAQGYELQLGTHCYGPHLLTHLLEPALVRTARASPDVRVVWVESMMDVGTPQGGIIWDEQVGQPKLLKAPFDNYMQSKAGGVFLAHEWSRRLQKYGITSVSLNPGLVRTELQRFNVVVSTLMGVVFKPAKYAAYTELFAGFSPDLTTDDEVLYVIPWGRVGHMPEHITSSMKSSGNSLSRTFWEYCEEVTKDYC